MQQEIAKFAEFDRVREHIFIITGDTGIGKSTLIRVLEALSTLAKEDYVVVRIENNKSITEDFQTQIVQKLMKQLKISSFQELQTRLYRILVIWVCEEFTIHNILFNQELQFLKSTLDNTTNSIVLKNKHSQEIRIPFPFLILNTNDTQSKIETYLSQNDALNTMNQRMRILNLYRNFLLIDEFLIGKKLFISEKVYK